MDLAHLMRESKDATGHEHAADGTLGTGGAAKAKLSAAVASVRADVNANPKLKGIAAGAAASSQMP